MLLIAVMVASNLFAQIDTTWLRRYSGMGVSADRGNAITIDKNGFLYVTGFSYSASTSNDFLTIKYYPNGDTFWLRKFERAGDDRAQAIAVDASGSVYVAGFVTNTNRDYCVVKYNANGDTLWTRTYNGASNNTDEANAIAVDGSGNVYLTGRTYVTSYGYDYGTVKYDANGVYQWLKTYRLANQPVDDVANGIVLDASGNVYITGYGANNTTVAKDYITIKYNPAGTQLWLKQYNGPPGTTNDEARAIAIDNAGYIYVTGYSIGSATDRDYLTIKYNNSGDSIWAHRYTGLGGVDADEAFIIKVDNSGNVYVTGYSYTTSTDFDFSTIKYNSVGETLWTRRYNYTNYVDQPKGLAVDKLGNVCVTGYVTLGTGYTDCVTIKYDANGDCLWTHRYNGTANSYDQCNGVAVDTLGNIYITGYSNGSGSGEDCITMKYSTRDIAVAKIIQPTGDIDSSTTIIPRVQVKNYGNISENFNVTLKIPSFGYSNTQLVSNLPPLDSAEIDFVSLTVGLRGIYSVRCSTGLAVDMVKYNDTLSGLFTVQVRDYAVTSITPITVPVDSGGAITPVATVENFGSLAGVNVPVIMYIPGTSYSDTQYVSLSAGASVSQTFTAYNAYIPRGFHTLKCTTRLNGDVAPLNNKDTTVFSIRVSDFGISSISSPPTFVDTGALVIPKAWICNYGTTDHNDVAVTFYINGPGLNYTSSRTVSLLAGNSVEQTFDQFYAHLPMAASYAMRCTVGLDNDMVAANNKAIGTFFLQLTDVGVLQINNPLGNIDSTASVAVSAVVKNLGTQPETFNVTFAIGSWTNTKQVTAIPPNSTLTVNFDPWSVGPRGNYNVMCYTQFVDDPLNYNDTTYGSLSVKVNDVGIYEIIEPVGNIDSTGFIAPKLKVKNFGTETATFNVTFQIHNWNNTQTVENLNGGAMLTVEFIPWQVIPRGAYPIRCSTYLAGDMVSANNVMSDSISIGLKDMAVTRICAPRDTCYFYNWCTPRATIYNLGTQTQYNLPVTLTIDNTFYSNTQFITINSGDSVLLGFDAFMFSPSDFSEGQYNLCCSIPVAGDIVVNNNMLTDSFCIFYRSWRKQADLPIPDKGIKAGGAICIHDSVIYVLQGRNTTRFYAYHIGDDNWIEKCSIPIISTCKKKVKAGGGLTVCNGLIYALKGSNSCEFWAFNPADDSWSRKKSITGLYPGAYKPTTIKAGGAITACRDSVIYAFKGGNTYEFWMYDVASDSWYPKQQLQTPDCKKIKAGGTLTAQGCTLYAFVGNGTKYFFMYLTEQDSWVRMKDIAFGAPKKKIKDGAAMTVNQKKVFAFKGGNTYDFGYYSIAADTWFTLENVPALKKVAAGGSMASFGAFIYAIKGNDTRELWRYILSDTITQTEKTQASILPIMLNIKPDEARPIKAIVNSVNKKLLINFSVASSDKVSVKLYNATGQLVDNLHNDNLRAGKYSMNFGIEHLSKGIYFLKYEDITQKYNVKLIIY